MSQFNEPEISQTTTDTQNTEEGLEVTSDLPNPLESSQKEQIMLEPQPEPKELKPRAKSTKKKETGPNIAHLSTLFKKQQEQLQNIEKILRPIQGQLKNSQKQLYTTKEIQSWMKQINKQVTLIEKNTQRILRGQTKKIKVKSLSNVKTNIKPKKKVKAKSR